MKRAPLALAFLASSLLGGANERLIPAVVGRAVGIDVYEVPQFYDWIIGGVKVMP